MPGNPQLRTLAWTSWSGCGAWTPWQGASFATKARRLTRYAPAFMWCRRLELGAHQGWCPLLHALFKAAKTLPALRTNATVSAITTGVFMADLTISPPSPAIR
jgi:hypothetical protein